ncbi:MAG TPA: BREX system ATP-binding domain-containing protein, partial [Thermomicrobiales bacterium]|nr:BREX system ATP-binding domain-containing protein [Thermomicrobiales bacterium]
MPRTRSAFGLLLRNHRRQRGLSQAALAHRIAAIVGEGADEQNGFLSEKAISNLEAPREPGEHVTPRVSTVVILARALGIERGTPVFDAFLGAATHKREQLTGTLDPAETPFGGVGLRPVVTAGREDEIQRLNAHLLDALAGTAQIVFLAGDSGIGKTFLINHFCRRAVASHPSLVVAIDDANSPSGLGEPYLPFKRLLALLSGDLSTAGSDQLLTGDHAERLRRLTIPAAETLIAHGPALVG